MRFRSCDTSRPTQVCDAATCGSLSRGQVCNAGPLGNNDGAQEETTYRGITYTYSGYYGDGTNYGNEWVRIDGVICSLLTPLTASSSEAQSALV